MPPEVYTACSISAFTTALASWGCPHLRCLILYYPIVPEGRPFYFTLRYTIPHVRLAIICSARLLVRWLLRETSRNFHNCVLYRAG